MNINPVSQPILHAMEKSGSSSQPNSTQDPQSMFIQILTAQLQSQTPLDPVSPTEFTSQLVQFNMLNQLAQINQTLQGAFGKTK